ncbi:MULTISPECIES: Crp/Fnr family transcriptional regulator [unclassified Flavobacterium]|uniref:Crp/Fnr family transcriptional regulator n=1 Tax=unclassified Flavobacterium TaxID=196869 RepID=UPI00260D1514|nr:Crp/Fnr family transcriptional regulator [Flavobacterium sp.]
MTATEIVQSIHPLPEKSLQKILDRLSEVAYPKGHYLIESNKIENDIYFIKKGMARAFCYTSDTEVTFWFGREGGVVLSFNSYIFGKTGYETIELLENAELYHIKASELKALYEEDIHIANWGRKLSEYELVKTEERLISRQFKSALERYEELIKGDPELLNRVSLGHIASYLGVTQVTLSRIRAEIR